MMRLFNAYVIYHRPVINVEYIVLLLIKSDILIREHSRIYELIPHTIIA
jgi:hypothetical protein